MQFSGVSEVITKKSTQSLAIFGQFAKHRSSKTCNPAYAQLLHNAKNGFGLREKTETASKAPPVVSEFLDALGGLNVGWTYQEASY